jgi:hypothetical protein
VRVKTPRQIAVADHLWDTFGRMAEEMGSERDALVNQAMHVFARLNGFVVPDGAQGAANGERRGVAVPPPPPLGPDPAERSAAAVEVLAAAARLERDLAARTPAGTPAPVALVLVREDGTTLEVAKERFLVGRGKHCDLVIDSPKVSREHAAISREPGGWFIEDLGSSNGTWHERERVGKKRIDDGDDYFICSEKLRCVLR